MQQNEQQFFQDENVLIEGDEGQFQQTMIFKKSAVHFTVTCMILVFHALFKLSGSLFFLFLYIRYGQCNQAPLFRDTLISWLQVLAFHSIVGVIYYSQMVFWITKPQNKQYIALKLDQFNNLDQNIPMSIADETRKVSIMSVQIKYEVQKKNCCSKFMSRLGFFTYQICFFWGMGIFFSIYHKTEGCDNWMFFFLTVILFLGIYQYIDFYIIALFAIICSPLLLIAGIYYCLNLCQKRNIQQRMNDMIQSIKYKPNLIQGDPQCSICYSTYQIDEDIIILQCSPLHHFHESCIKTWISASNSCPLCRSAVII